MPEKSGSPLIRVSLINEFENRHKCRLIRESLKRQSRQKCKNKSGLWPAPERQVGSSSMCLQQAIEGGQSSSCSSGKERGAVAG